MADFRKMIVATHNKGKYKEFASLLKDTAITPIPPDRLGLPVPDETGETFIENALIKAKAATTATGLPALADDSGLCVDALDGRPGVYTADYAPDYPTGMAKLLTEIGDHPDRRAHFICVLALCWPDGSYKIFEGRADGVIAPKPRGKNGHGYDPLFIPEGDTRTFSEMPEDEKNQQSARGRAARALTDFLSNHDIAQG